MPEKKLKRGVKPKVKKIVEKKKTGPKKRDPMVAFLPKLERYIILGYNITNACLLSGLPDSTVSDYYRSNEKFRRAIDGLLLAPNVKARANIVKSINDGNVGDSWRWLSAREKDDFSTRQETTGKDGEPITTPIEVVFVRKDK